jgi:hypothetical protein
MASGIFTLVAGLARRPHRSWLLSSHDNHVVMITTNRYHHTRGFPPIAAPPWLYNLYHQSILIVPLIFPTIFAQPFASYSSVTTIFGSFHFLAHRDTSPPLLLQPTLFSVNFLKKNYHPLVFTPAKTIQPIISFRRRSLFLYLPHLFHHPAPIVPCQHHLLLHT